MTDRPIVRMLKGPGFRLGGLAIALAVGVWGLITAWAEAGTTVTTGRLASGTAGLLVGAVPGDLTTRALPASLDIATLLAPVFAGWSVIALLWLTVRNPVRLRSMRWRGDHMIVAADGTLAQFAVDGELQAGRPVLIWKQGAAAGWTAGAAVRGAAVAAEHQDPGIATARAVLLAGPDDVGNIDRADRVLTAAAATRSAGDPLNVITRVDDIGLRTRDEERRANAAHPSARLRYASLPELAARELFLAAPFDAFVRHGATTRNVVVIGLTPTLERYVARILVGNHPRDGNKARFTVLTADATAAEAGFRARYANADALSPITFQTCRLDRPSAAIVSVAPHAVAFVIDCGGDALTCNWGETIAANFRSADRPCPPIHLRLDQTPAALPPMLRPFGCIDGFADPDLLVQEEQDYLARSIHEFYLQGRLNEGDRIGVRDSMREWDDLLERFRDDNRLVSDCYQLKLRDIGARLVGGGGPPLRFTADELEDLARAEHDRWMIAKLATGWIYGESRDDARKIHPDIVPYDSLSERIKDLDREQIRIMTRLLAASGQRAVRTLTVALLPGADTWPRLGTLIAELARHYPDRLPVLAVDGQDAAACGALQSLGPGGWRTLVMTTGYVLEDGHAAPLVRTSDTIVAVDAEQDLLGAMLNRCDLALTAASTGQVVERPLIRLGRDGNIVEAPWLR